MPRIKRGWRASQELAESSFTLHSTGPVKNPENAGSNEKAAYPKGPFAEISPFALDSIVTEVAWAWGYHGGGG